jgi:phosphoglycolate phosphatase
MNISNERLSIGLDLDLTLVDTREATAYAVREVNRELSAAVDVEEFVRRLGPPIKAELECWIDKSDIDLAVACFRKAFTSETGLAKLSPAPGAVELLAWMDKESHAAVVITSRLQSVASKILGQCGMDPSALYGGLTGIEKASAMTHEGISFYVGDHPLDMEGARAAGVHGIGITSGSHTGSELREAGAEAVFPSLMALQLRLESGAVGGKGDA